MGVPGKIGQELGVLVRSSWEENWLRELEIGWKKNFSSEQVLCWAQLDKKGLLGKIVKAKVLMVYTELLGKTDEDDRSSGKGLG